MRKLWLLVILAVLLLGIADAQNTTLTGTIVRPDSSGYTGTLWLSLSQTGSVLASCSGGPKLVLPAQFIAVPVVAGTITGGPWRVWGYDCLLPSPIPYNVKVTDRQNNTLMTDQWLIFGTTFDVGTAISISNPNIRYPTNWPLTTGPGTNSIGYLYNDGSGLLSWLNSISLTAHTPSTSSEACTAGQHVFDTSYYYICTASNTWKRIALSSF